MDAQKLVTDVLMLSETINRVGAGYFHTQPVSRTNIVVNRTDIGETANATLFDWGIIAAITESPLCLTGDTDRGKTDYAKILLTALMGEEEKAWHKTDIDSDFGSLTYSGQNYGAITDGQTSAELFFAKPFVKFPGLIWDELNRAPAKLITKLLHILEKDFALENGDRVHAGHEYQRAEAMLRYQLHILAYNEGDDDFHGTSPIDRAMKRRQPIEIPFDVFQTRMVDKKRMAEERSGDLIITNGDGHLETILDLLHSIDDIPISPEAEHMRLFLQSTGYCPHSLSDDKKGINFQKSMCSKIKPQNLDGTPKTDAGGTPLQGCHYLATYPQQMCPNVYNLGDGNSIKLMKIAKAHSLIRILRTAEVVAKHLEITRQQSATSMRAAAQNYSVHGTLKKIAEASGIDTNTSPTEVVKRFMAAQLENLQVEPTDIQTVFPFVSRSKLPLSQPWVQRQYQGGRWYAIQALANEAYTRTTGFHAGNPELAAKLGSGAPLSDADHATLNELGAQDVWLGRSFEAYTQDTAEKNNPRPSPEMIRNVLRF
ncbi:hypothetical protein HN587_02235 [Candidatus Woesearchaeota archaeon]|jgi:hypothetical protein|nr:hypothetical protein [Candidatus Woesearchaeota archaeon]